MPYQPRERARASRSRAPTSTSSVSARGLSGYVVPSRLYGILAAGRPVIVAADDESETARVVREVGCGVVIPPGGPELLPAAIRDAHEERRDELAAMGAAAASTSSPRPTASVAIGRYRALLRSVIGSRDRARTGRWPRTAAVPQRP